MQDINLEIFEQLGITYWEEVYARVRYAEPTLKGITSKKYQYVIHYWKDMVADNWIIGLYTWYMSNKRFWEFSKGNGLDINGNPISAKEYWI